MKEYEKEFYSIKWSNYKKIPKETRRFVWIASIIYFIVMLTSGTISFLMRSNIFMLTSYVVLIPSSAVYLHLVSRNTEMTIDELVEKNNENAEELWKLLSNDRYKLNTELGLKYCLDETERINNEPKYIEAHIIPIFKLIYRWLAPIIGFIIGIQQQVTNKDELLTYSFIVLIIALFVLGLLLMIYGMIESKLNRRYYVSRVLLNRLRDVSYLYDDGKLA